jgi:nucleoside-diphosphate-sugar epimerase
MKLLITGSSGFIGTNFIKTENIFEIIEVDLLIINVDEICFSGIDSVLHLAALVHQMKGAPEEQYYKINRDLAFKVAKKAKGQRVKHFVLMSTAKVYGESTTGMAAWNENSDCNPIDAYGKSKFEAEKLIMSLQDENFKVAIVRSPLVYGIGVKANMYNLVQLVNKFPVLPLKGIINCRSFVYVGNLVALLLCIIEKQASGIFIAGDKISLSTSQLTEVIIKASKRKVIQFKIPRIFIMLAKKIKPSITDRLFGSLELDNTTTNKRLDFIPPYETEQGIQEMVEWYLESKKKKF